MFEKCKELFNKLELDIPEACIEREMVYRKRKDCVKCRITLGLTKTRMDLIKEAINLARESDQISYMFADINCGLFVKPSNGSFKFFNITDDLNNV